MSSLSNHYDYTVDIFDCDCEENLDKYIKEIVASIKGFILTT